MTNRNLLSASIAIIAVAIGIMNYMSINELNDIRSEWKESLDSELEDVVENEIELAKAMGYLQTYTHKLYWAGQNENWQLSHFYAHEIGETIEEVGEANVIKQGQDISMLIGSITNSSLEKIEKSIKEEDPTAFADSYKLLIQSCNECHSATDYKFIKIELPSKGKLFNQRFSK